jgi:hypothetical protein
MSTGPAAGEERFFAMREIREARDWALAGGIAIHRNFDVDGLVIGSRRRSGPAFHVFGNESVLLEWGRRYRLNPRWLQHNGRNRGWPPHFDVFGGLARRLVELAAKDRMKDGAL